MTTSAQEKPSKSRRIGLDKPCSMCGSAIYFNYSGPLDGICGKCTDRLRHRLGERVQGSTRVRGGSRSGGFGWGSLLLAFVAGAAAAAIALLSGWIQF